MRLTSPTIVIVSKSSRVIQAADQVVAMNNGRVVFRGTPGDYSIACEMDRERMGSHPHQSPSDPLTSDVKDDEALELFMEASSAFKPFVSLSPQPSGSHPSGSSKAKAEDISSMSPPVAFSSSSRGGSVEVAVKGGEVAVKGGEVDVKGGEVAVKGIMSSPLMSWNQPQASTAPQPKPSSGIKKTIEEPKVNVPGEGRVKDAQDQLGHDEDDGKIEERQVGHVKWNVYKAYFSSVGYPTVVLVALTLILMQGTKNASDVWVGLWVSDQNPQPNDSSNHMQGLLAPVAHLAAPMTSLLTRFPLATLPFSFVRSIMDGSTHHPPPHHPLHPPLPSPPSAPSTPNFSPPLPPSPLISTSTFLHILLTLAALNSLFTLGRAFSFAFAGMSAAKTTHEKLLSSILRAPMSFFDSVSSGQIVNRFSSDASKVDDSLPFIFNIFLANLVTLLGLLSVMTFSSPALVLFLVPSSLFYLRLSTYYRSTSREVRRLDSASLAPIYTSFSEVSDAAPCIRGFGLQDLFYRKHVAFVRSYQRASISGCAAGVWLGALGTILSLLPALTHFHLQV